MFRACLCFQLLLVIQQSCKVDNNARLERCRNSVTTAAASKQRDPKDKTCKAERDGPTDRQKNKDRDTDLYTKKNIERKKDETIFV